MLSCKIVTSVLPVPGRFVAKSSRETQKSSKHGQRDVRGDLPLRQHCESAHLAGALQLRLQTLRRRQGMKRGGKTSAPEGRFGASRVSHTREREREMCRVCRDAEISVKSCRDFNMPRRSKPNKNKLSHSVSIVKQYCNIYHEYLMMSNFAFHI